MMGEKVFESSDDDDSDFEITTEQDSSCASSASESESIITENNDTEETNHKKRKRNTVKKNIQFKKQSCTTNSSNNSVEIRLSPKEEKARADSLWQNFLNDTATSSRARTTNMTSSSANTSEVNSHLSTDTNKTQNKYPHNAKIDSTKTRNIDSSLNSLNKNGGKINLLAQGIIHKKTSISSILNNVKKEGKLTTLEKSKLEWNKFKEEHNLEEEISNFNRGKSGYLERQDFLQRTDLKQFEIEKQLRNIGKRKTR